jgi:hypothetical protein
MGFLPGWNNDDDLWLRFFDQACEIIPPRPMPSASDHSEHMEPTTLTSVATVADRMYQAVMARKEEAC